MALRTTCAADGNCLHSGRGAVALGRRPPRAADLLQERRHAGAAVAAGDDVVEPAHVHVDVEGEPVGGDAVRDFDADCPDLAIAHPHAGPALQPPLRAAGRRSRLGF